MAAATSYWHVIRARNMLSLHRLPGGYELHYSGLAASALWSTSTIYWSTAKEIRYIACAQPAEQVHLRCGDVTATSRCLIMTLAHMQAYKIRGQSRREIYEHQYHGVSARCGCLVFQRIRSARMLRW